MTGRFARARPIAAVARDIGFVSIGKYGQYLVTLATLPLLARVLGTAGLGLLAIGMSGYFLGALLVDFGMTSYLAARVPGADLAALRGSYLALRGGVVAGLGAVLGITAISAVPQHISMIALGLFIGGFGALGEDWVLIGEGRFGASALYQALGRIGYLALLIGLLPRYPSATTALLCLLASTTLTVAATWIAVSHRHGRPGPLRLPKELLRTALPVLLGRLLTTGYGQGAPAMYSVALSPVALGLYSAADRVVRAVQSLLDPIGLALLPRLVRRDLDGTLRRDGVRALAVCVTIAAVAAATTWAAGPLLVHVLLGAAFTDAVAVLRVEVLILPATTVSSFVTTAILPVCRDTLGALAGALLGTGIAAVALCIALRTHSLWTLVYGSVLAEYSVAGWYLVRMWQVLARRTALPEGAGAS